MLRPLMLWDGREAEPELVDKGGHLLAGSLALQSGETCKIGEMNSWFGLNGRIGWSLSGSVDEQCDLGFARARVDHYVDDERRNYDGN